MKIGFRCNDMGDGKMTPAEVKKSNSEFVERWKRVGPLLEDIRIREISRYSYDDNVHIIDGLLQIGFDFGSPRKTSGLVELQKWLAKAKR
jgi:hypothetical protein